MLQKYSKNILLIAVVAILLAILGAYGYLREQKIVIDYSFYEMLQKNDFITKAEMDEHYITLYTNDNSYLIAKDAIDIKELVKKVPLEIDSRSDMMSQTLDAIILIFIILFMIAIFRNLKKQPQKEREERRRQEEKTPVAGTLGLEDMQYKVMPMRSNITFDDVAGIKEVKEELEEITDFLKNPLKYKKFGVKLPKGVLLIGPPGVGKTLIAKAVAGEANVPFFYQSGSSFVQIYVGMGAKRVRDLFVRAKAMSPSIVFIDEIDAVGKARGGFRNDERESTLNQLLTEMDGFEDSSGVIVIGATNKIDMLDEALLRSGRFDRRVFVELPTLQERTEIFKVYLRDKKHNLEVEKLAKITVGFSGAAIAALVNEAAIAALKRGASEIELQDFLNVKDEVLLGKKKKLSFSEEEKKILATYQAAKAISAYWFEVDFDKISLVSDGLKEIDKEIVSRSEMISKVKVYLAGTAALEMLYGERFSNNQEDLFKAKMIATDMVEKYGMGENIFALQNDAVVIINNALEEMKKFLSGLKMSVEKVKMHLLEEESISKPEIKEYLGEIF